MREEMNWEKQLVKGGRREKRKVEGTRVWRKTCGCGVRVSMCEHKHIHATPCGSCVEMEEQPLGVGPCLSTLIESCPFVTAEASSAGSGLLGFFFSSLPSAFRETLGLETLLHQAFLGYLRMQTQITQLVQQVPANEPPPKMWTSEKSNFTGQF